MNIGRYEVIKELGQGGMAIVYLARDPYVKRQVAIKVLPKQFTFDPQFRARFQREAEVIATLEHPSIVPVYDFGEHEDQPFIVMRYMSAGTLSDRLTKGSLPIAEITTLFQRIGSAMDYAHKAGVVHRDIKPGNILFDAQGEACLSDFGIAKMAQSSSAFTGTGTMVGTPAYMSPEQAKGEKNIDGRSDIYSLGVILFESLSGQLPFNADTPMGAAVAHINQPVPSLLELQPDLPPKFENVILKALDKDPSKRYQTASELAQAIKNANMPSTDGTMIEQPAKTVSKSVKGTLFETPSHAQPIQTPPSLDSAQRNNSSSGLSQPATKKSVLPKVFGFGSVGLLFLCLCAGIVGGFATGLIPNPFTKPTTETPTLNETSETEIPTSQPTIAPTNVIVTPSAPTTDITFEGHADASSMYDLDYAPAVAIDGDLTTSWLSAGPDADGTSTFVWTGIQEDVVFSIELVSNRDNQETEFRIDHGFGEVIVQLYNAADELVFEETVNLDGTPDPDVIVYPNAVGQWVWLILKGSEARNASGFAELRVNVIR